MTGDSLAIDDLSRGIIHAQRTIPSPAVSISHTGPHPPTSAQSQRPLPKSRAEPRRFLGRHLPEGGDDGGDDNDPPSDEEPPYLPLLMRIEDVMWALAISRRTIYELIKVGKLHLVRVGIRGSRIRTEEVLKLAGTTFMPLRIPRLRNQIKDESAAESL
jgi:excisionase family DNA binding protein